MCPHARLKHLDEIQNEIVANPRSGCKTTIVNYEIPGVHVRRTSATMLQEHNNTKNKKHNKKNNNNPEASLGPTVESVELSGEKAGEGDDLKDGFKIGFKDGAEDEDNGSDDGTSDGSTDGASKGSDDDNDNDQGSACSGWNGNRSRQVHSRMECCNIFSRGEC